MPGRFAVLASGSSGNAAFLHADAGGLLIDCGVSPRTISARLGSVGAAWKQIAAVLLTHTHGDHWNKDTFAHMLRLRVKFYAHADHDKFLSTVNEDYAALRVAGLVRLYADGVPFRIGAGLQVLPVRLPHDSEPTFGFRIEGHDRAMDQWWAIGYASDLGHVPPALLAAFAGVDLVAIESNHDVELQRTSRRPQMLIDRCLGQHGHLSNQQAAEAIRSIARDGSLTTAVQLHLSRECNTPDLARASLQGSSLALITATQTAATKVITLAGSHPEPAGPAASSASRIRVQLALPGLE